MAFVHGSNSYVSVDGTDVSAYVDSVSFSRGSATSEVSVFTNNDEAFIAGLESGSFSMSGPWDATLDGVMDGCFDGATVAIVYGPAGNTGGFVSITANCFITGYDPASSVTDRVQWSASFTKSGDVTVGTF